MSRHESKSGCGQCYVYNQVKNKHHKILFQTELYNDELYYKAVYVQLYTGLLQLNVNYQSLSALGMDCSSITLFFPLLRH